MAEPPTPVRAPAPPRARRLFSLCREYERLLRLGFASRMGRAYAYGMAIGYGALVVYRASRGDAEGAAAFFRLALSGISVAAGLVAWSAARDLSADERTSGLTYLSSVAGFGAKDRRLAKVLATMMVVGRAVGFPALGVALVAAAAAPGPSALVAATALASGAAFYALVFGVTLGGLSRWASELLPEHGRFLFAIVVLVPFLAGDALHSPDLVSALGWLIDKVGAWGGVT